METIVNVSDSADALLINQLYSVASGGDFWESGGQLSTAGSSTDIQLSVSSVTVNIGGQTITHGSQPVTLSATSGEYRTDVIYADESGVSALEGVEMAKLPQDNQFPSIWQPAPDNGSLVPGVPLHVVHVTPGDAASADIESWQTQNRRMNATTLSSARLASLLENYDVDAGGAVETTVTNSEQLAGRSAADWQQGLSASILTDTAISPDSFGTPHAFRVPTGYTLYIHRWGVMTGGGTTGSVRIKLEEDEGSGWIDRDSTDSASQTVEQSYGAGLFRWMPRNLSADTTLNISATIAWGVYPQ